MRFLAVLATTVLVTPHTAAEELVPVGNESMTQVVAFGRVLAESHRASEFPNRVKIVTFPPVVAECWGKIETCPDIRLVFILTTGDLYDEPHLFELPKSKGWEFVSWFSPEDRESGGFKVRTTLPEANIDPVEREKWTSATYKVEVSVADARFEIVGSDD